ncbi:hypothetical protein QUF88_10615 [Bacillus sp. DX1.1]|uniref:hypothetical protein n=1 Tax=unclassified Bacillus (in: firmicutes) TaxID=185979 RepID=UPI002570BF1B|nr:MULTISPECIES: hypothetical protein [unclassified Bacillus (in: firmicutes)]MDM5154273.1 hypothetical protein [Bacillus sp. DX1.1]WJE83191.1 hypothetical protein QRE67_08120 [Bacillus sp. DX3.1]
MRKRIFIMLGLFLIMAGCSSSNYDMQVETGMKSLKDGNYSDATMWFEKAEKEKSTNEAKTYMNIAKWMDNGATALKAGKYQEAMENANQVIQTKKDATLEKAVKANAEEMLQQAKDIEQKEKTKAEKQKKIDEEGIDKAIKAVDSVDEVREKQKKVGEALDKAEEAKEKIEAKKN